MFLGIDVGSMTVKVAALRDNTLLGWKVALTGVNSQKTTENLLEQLLTELGSTRAEIDYVVATGYGRRRVSLANEMITEITCHARGAVFFHPEARTIIDIGGQDSKVIRADERGKVVKFAMNDKCAAGTGRFLEVMARALEVEIDQMGELALLRSKVLPISSTCTVFAESEVIGMLARGEDGKDIAAGIHDSIATRLKGMVRRVGVEEDVLMTGGVAKNRGMLEALSETVGTKIVVPREPQIVGAVGASLLARDAFVGKGAP